MQERYVIRALRPEEVGAALDLVWAVFQDFEAPDYTPEVVAEFYKSIHDESYLAQLAWHGAFAGETLVGVIATRSAGTHIALFFVDGGHHRRGIGRQLFQAARGPAPRKMTVHSSPYAVPVYHKLGFRDTAPEQIVHGLRFTPMELAPDSVDGTRR